jgi:acylphosphatase
MAKQRQKYKTPDGKMVLMIMFEGEVQMVSFRYTSCQYATIAELSGYCKNTDDNEVECLFKGPEDIIMLVIEQLLKEFNIRGTRAVRLPISDWESNEAFYVDRNGIHEPYMPYVYVPVTNYNGNYNFNDKYYVNNEDSNDLGRYGDDACRGNVGKRHLTKEDIDYINGFH